MLPEAVPLHSSSDIQSDKDDINGKNGASDSSQQLSIKSDNVPNQVRCSHSLNV